MGLFEKLMALSPLQSYLQMDDADFVEERGWRTILGKVKQLKDPDTIVRIIGQAAPQSEKAKIILGFLCTMAGETGEGPVELPCVDYGGCYLTRGEIRFQNRSRGYSPQYLGMGMAAKGPETKISIEGNAGDYLGYRSACMDIEVQGNAGDRVGMAVGEGQVQIDGDVSGGLGGNSQNVRFEVLGSAGAIYRHNNNCTILVGEDLHKNIEEGQNGCFIRISGDVGVDHKNSENLPEVAPDLAKNSLLLIGGDVYGSLGKGLGVARILIWGKVYGRIEAAESEGGFIYLNKKSAPILQRIKQSFGGRLSVKHIALKESGYLFVESPEDVKELILD
jgi:hypothetical protein